MDADANVIIKNKDTGKVLTTKEHGVEIELKITLEGEVIIDSLFVLEEQEEIIFIDDWDIVKIDFCFWKEQESEGK